MPEGKGWNTKVSGDIYPKNIREVKSNNFIFFINPSNQDTKTYFIKVKTTSMSNIKVAVEQLNDAVASSENENLINGVFIGILIMFALIFSVSLTLDFTNLSLSLICYVGISILFSLSFNGVLLNALPNHLSHYNDIIYKALLIFKLATSILVSFAIIKKIEGPSWYIKFVGINFIIFTFFFFSIITPFYLATMNVMIKYSILIQCLHLFAIWQSKKSNIKNSIFVGYFIMMIANGLFQSNLILSSYYFNTIQLVSLNTLISCLVFIWIYSIILIDDRRALVQEKSKRYAHELNIKSNGLLFDIMAHEFKNALSVINLSSSTLERSIDLKDTKFVDKALLKKRISNIQESTLRVTSFLQRCIKLNEIEDGRVILNPIYFDFHELIGVINKELTINGYHNDIKVVPPQKIIAPINMNKDYFLFKIMLYNLIENACKYSSNKSEIKVKLDQDLEEINIEVINESSVGLPDKNRLFQKYYRSKNASHINGSGLGLAFVRSIARIFDGDVTYSHDNHFVKFTINMKR
jgi:signal transduction histidine kinase